MLDIKRKPWIPPLHWHLQIKYWRNNLGAMVDKKDQVLFNKFQISSHFASIRQFWRRTVFLNWPVQIKTWNQLYGKEGACFYLIAFESNTITNLDRQPQKMADFASDSFPGQFSIPWSSYLTWLVFLHFHEVIYSASDFANELHCNLGKFCEMGIFWNWPSSPMSAK